MGKIHILDTEVTNKIAAGEVVERPLSIVKELVENSIDAGATHIAVEIKDGGISYIKVTDNGSGMSEEDAKICFLRHATSKISNGSDLEAIYTLGFRGEALSSIGAVSKIQLYTKQKSDNDGICVTCEGGEILSSAVSGVPDGTVIEVRDLFYNTPARRKFLKKASVEGGYISDIISRYIFAHPEISFKLIRDGKEILFSSGDNNMINAVYAVYGKDYAKNMLPVAYDFNGISVTGLVGKGTLSRANRNYETFLVNKRYIKSGLMIRALEEAYKNQIMIAKFPTAILNVEVPANSIDINVHPTKLECKFSQESDIYQAVYHAVKSALYALPNVPQIERSEDNEEEKQQVREYISENRGTQRSLEDIFREKLKETERKKEEERNPVPTDAASKLDPFVLVKRAIENAEKNKGKSDKGIRVESPLHSDSGRSTQESIPQSDWKEYLAEQVKNAEEAENPFAEGYFRIIGQLFDTYILVEKDDLMLMIDQHAAHERLNFEALKEELKERGVASQSILEPIEINLAVEEAEVYSDNEEMFYKLGFECSVGDNGKITITSIPGDISWSDGETLFFELLSQMSDMKQNVISDKAERLLYTISCKAAIKANMNLSEIEMYNLVRKVFALKNINTCPHGRPIVISMSKKEIEKDFKRIV